MQALPRKTAIIGGGPAGSVLAAALSRKNIRAVVFDPGQRPELIVGESLIPSVVPVLRRLGIEEEVASFSLYKPGAAFFLKPGDETKIVFAKEKGAAEYSYNVPRDKFDAAVRAAARRAGATFVDMSASVESVEGAPALGKESAEAFESIAGGEPDIIIDASGRNRLLSRLLGIGELRGKRRDTALFAHLSCAELQHEGCIHIDRLSHGWSWRIPLPGRVSVGIVVPGEVLRNFGERAEAQYDAFLAESKVLGPLTRGSRRLTGVMKYNNYQLISDRFFGKGWALVGDAAGFTDPIFSAGLHLSLTGAELLAEALSGKISLEQYEATVKGRLEAWQHVVESFYDGRLFGVSRAARLGMQRFPWSWLLPQVQKHLRRTLSGMVPTDSLSFNVSRFILDRDFARRYGERLRVR